MRYLMRATRASVAALVLGGLAALAAGDDGGMVMDPYGVIRTRTPASEASFRGVVTGVTTRPEVERLIGRPAFPNLRSARPAAAHHKGDLFDLSDVAVFYRPDDVVDRIVLRFRRPEPASAVAQGLRLGPPTGTRTEDGVAVTVHEAQGVEMETTPEGTVAALRLVARSVPEGWTRRPERAPRYLHLGEIGLGPAVAWAGRDGVELGAFLEAPGLRGSTVATVARLFDASGRPLLAAQGAPPEARDASGALTLAASDQVLYDDSAWMPFKVFLPTDALPASSRGLPVRASFTTTCGVLEARSEAEIAVAGVPAGTRLRSLRVAFVDARQASDAVGTPGIAVEARFEARGFGGSGLEATLSVRDAEGRPVRAAWPGPEVASAPAGNVIRRQSEKIGADAESPAVSFFVALDAMALPVAEEHRLILDLEGRAGGFSARRMEEVSVFPTTDAASSDADAVQGVVQAFLDAMVRGDTAAARRLAGSPLAEELARRPAKPPGRAPRVTREVSPPRVDGASATVEMLVRFADLQGLWSVQRMTLRLARADQGWKVTTFAARPVLPELEDAEVSR